MQRAARVGCAKGAAGTAQTAGDGAQRIAIDPAAACQFGGDEFGNGFALADIAQLMRRLQQRQAEFLIGVGPCPSPGAAIFAFCAKHLREQLHRLFMRAGERQHAGA